VSRASRFRLQTIEALLAVSLLVVFLVARDLPLVDLPQHALQLKSWLRIDAHEPGVSALELNFRTPYLLAYPVARALAQFLPVLVALKLTFWASITLQALTLRRLCEALGHDPWLGLLGFPLGLGYSFCFGFVAFCAALPLVHLAFLFAARLQQAPNFRRGAALAATLSLLLVAHGVALGFLFAVLGPFLLVGQGRWWQRLWPFAAPPLLGLIWLVPAGSSTRLGGDLWQLEPQRLLEIPGQLVGIGAADAVATLFGLLLLAAVYWSLGARRSWSCFLPLVAALGGYALFPTMFHGAGPLGPRFSAYFVPAALLAFAPRKDEPERVTFTRRGVLLFVAVGVPLVFALRLPQFNRELASFHQLTNRVPAGLAVRPIVFERASPTYPGTPALLHVPAYYALEKGGTAGYSFAMYSISVVRLKPGVHVRMGGGMEWAPELFDAAREADEYDYFIVKSESDRSAALFPGSQPAAVLEQHVGSWWGYRRRTAGGASSI
jgi:hypothetical protein